MSEQEIKDAASKGDLQRVIAWVEAGAKAGHAWDVNPIRAVIEGTGRWRVAELLLRRHDPDLLLLQARCPSSGNTLLHHAVSHRKQKLAILLINYLPDGPPRQGFLEAVNNHGQTALHLATQHLLTSVVEEFTLQTRLKMNMKDSNGKTTFDVITEKCRKLTLKDDWRTPWRISIMLRGAQAQLASELEPYKDEEDTIKELTAIESLIMNERSWSKIVNAILLVSTLALTLIFASIFTIPQILAPGGGNNTESYASVFLPEILSHNKSFSVFIFLLTLAGALMFCVISNIILIVTSSYEIRAYILCFSWACISITGISLVVAYIIVVYMYMGYEFTYIIIACVVIVTGVNIFLGIYFELAKAIWKTIFTLLRMTLLHGFFVTLLQTFLPKSIS